MGPRGSRSPTCAKLLPIARLEQALIANNLGNSVRHPFDQLQHDGVVAEMLIVDPVLRLT